MQRISPFVLLAVAGISLVFGACGTVSGPSEKVLDPRLAGPCDRLILSWSQDASSLRSMMGDRFAPQTADGIGEIQLNVLQCEPEIGRQPPLIFAFFSVPISADSAPLLITRMPDDGWAWLPALIVDSDSSAVFSSMGYPVETAWIEVVKIGHGTSVTATLTFASGRISIAAMIAGRRDSYSANKALVNTNSHYYSVFFGAETTDRFELASVDIDVQGDIPLADVHVDRPPKYAVLDRGLRLDRVYWRLPRSQSELERSRSKEP